MNKDWTVYKHTFPNGKVYIGITGMKPEKRWNDGHGYLGRVEGQYNQPLIARAIVKYGWSNILHEIVEDGLSEKAARKMEDELIIRYKSNDPEFGYNMAGGYISNKSELLIQHEQSVSHKTKCNQTGVVYSSMRKASKDTGVCITSIRNSCKFGTEYHGLSFSRIFDEISEERIE
jgi:hypothetical protein